MKRILSLFLALAIVLSFSGFGFAESPALPALGDTVEGFTVKEIREFPLLGADIILFEHDRTGAKLLYVANNDTNRVFDLTFFTRAIDNTGLPHVFEHATLNGSEKYPSTALFFNLMYQTYNTFMNAMTAPLFTTYPVASLSEEQLLKYADFYTDSCFHPMILEKESIFREEAWRYRLEKPEDDLTIEGTVYSEMLAGLNLDSMAYRNMLRAAFPGSTIGNESGGDPSYIPDMTWDALKDYHETYYHPSNCVAYLYGQFDHYEAFLSLLDEAFSPYEKREFTFDDAGYTPLVSSVEESLPFPVEAGSDTKNRSTIYYAFVCPGLKDDIQEELVLNTLTDLLMADASVLIQSLKKALPSGSFGSYIELDTPEDAILFYAANVNPEDAGTFRDTVNAALAEVAANGFPQDLVDGIMSSLSLSMKLSRENSSVGVNLLAAGPFVSLYASTGDPFNYLDYVDALEQMDTWNQNGRYKDAVTKWLTGNETTVLVGTYPEPGLREKMDAEEAERLAEVKASMTEEELSAIVAQTNAEKEEKDASALVAKLQAVTVSSLPEEIRIYDVADTTDENGLRHLSAEAAVDDVGEPLLFLDAAGLPQEDLHWFVLYTALLGEMDTSAHTHEELATLLTRYFYNGSIRLSLVSTYGTKEYHPYLRSSWIATDEDLAAGYDLLYEILYDTQFTDTEKLLGLITQNKASLKSSITNSPYSAQLYRAFGAFTPLYAYYDYVNFLPYYAFLDQAEQLMQSNPEIVISKLEQIQQFFCNRANTISAYAGSAEGIEVNTALADAFFAKLDDRPTEPVSYQFETSAQREALIVDSAVQYNCIVSDFDGMDLPEYTADLDAVSALISDVYLMPMLREQYGVYTPMHGYLEDAGSYFISYRDPNITETFDVYEALPEFLSSFETDQETLDGYILSSYAGYAMPEGELSGAISSITGVLTSRPEDLKLQYMQELKALTPDKVLSLSDAYAAMMNTGIRLTAGGAAALNAKADLYDVIFNPFGAVDTSQVDFSDALEGSDHYEAVRFVFENHLMMSKEETRFGAEDNASLGDLAGALYALVGGDASDPDTAAAFLAENGLLPPESDASAELTDNTAYEILSIFSQAVGIPFTAPDPPVEDFVLTRANLAEIIMFYTNGLG